jgi:hypothetical protein
LNFLRSLFAALTLCLLLAPGMAQAADGFSTASNSSNSSNAATARVFIVQDPNATDAFQARPGHVTAMVARGLTNLTGKVSSIEAWQSLVATQDIVGIKVFSEPGANSGTRPAVVAAVISGLLSAGVPAKQIIIWDKHQTDLRLAGYFELAKRLGVRVAGSAEAGYDENVFYETPLLGNLLWGDLEFGQKGDGLGRKSFVSKLVTQQMTKIINIAPMLNHNTAGVSGNLYSLALGSVDNTIRFESDADRLANAVPEIIALPALGDRVVLNIVDALICQYEGGKRGLLHYSTMLNELRFSRDPVALDMMSIQDLDRQRQLTQAPPVKPNLELYSNAALLELGVSDLKKIHVEMVK